MSKVLIITSVASMIDQFLLPTIFRLEEMGYDVKVACNFESGNTCNQEQIEKLKETLYFHRVEFYQIDFARNIMKVFSNIHAYKQILSVLSSVNWDFVHCHSPIGGVIGRLASRKFRKKGTKVFYTAHGFHFYQGAPLKNWILYYPIEKICSYFTDVLITINQEDYHLAKRKMKAKQIEYVPGVGVDLSRFKNTFVDKKIKRKEIGVPEDAILLLSVGELNDNKNHQIIIKALAELGDCNIHYAIAGIGEKRENLSELAKRLDLLDRIHLLGFRKDIAELNHSADIFCFPSIREGLSVALMEAMASSSPIVCSKIRGNIDLIDGNGGTMFDPHNVDDCKNALKTMQRGDLSKMGAYNQKKIQQFDLSNVLEAMCEIYEREKI